MKSLTSSQEARAFIANKITLALTVLESLRENKKNITKRVISKAIKDLRGAIKFLDGKRFKYGYLKD